MGRDRIPEANGPELIGGASAAAQLCFGYGFRFVNGRLVASSCPIFEGREALPRHLTRSPEKRPYWRHLEIGSVHISCPHCTTYYAIDLATLGEAGRPVRCSRCKEVWVARPEDATEMQSM